MELPNDVDTPGFRVFMKGVKAEESQWSRDGTKQIKTTHDYFGIYQQFMINEGFHPNPYGHGKHQLLAAGETKHIITLKSDSFDSHTLLVDPDDVEIDGRWVHTADESYPMDRIEKIAWDVDIPALDP